MNFGIKPQRINSILICFLVMMSLAFSKNAVYKITISGIIDLGLPPYIERVIETAEKDSADAIIFDIETPGGRVDAATQIKDAILGTDILTIAFINRRAISAGALISLSCEKIYMTGGGTIGAATAVDMQGNKASEKVISYMREEMASTAEIRGKDVTIARGMVDDSLSFTHLVIDGDSLEVNDIEGRKKGKLITLTTNLALKYKIADGEAESIEEVLNKIGLTNAIIKSSKENWSENLVRFLTNPIVASLLMTFGFLGILFELQSSGWGVPGTFGGVCLLLSLSASYIAKLATATDFIIIIVGVLLLLAEILFIPGFGIAGVSGIVIIFWGIYELLLPDIPVGAEAMSDAITGLTIGIIGGLIGLALLFRLVIKTKFWENLTAPGSENRKEGYSTSIGLESYAGQNGIADTDLRPSGWILVQEERIFVITEGTFINKGDSVKILSVDGNRVLVRQLNTEEK